MPVELILETGERAPEANSYVNLSLARGHTESRGLADVMTESLLLQAMDVLVSVPWSGEPVSSDQPLDWPRRGVIIAPNDYVVPHDSVPSAVAIAQVWAAWYISQGTDPATVAEPEVRDEAVGPLRTTYAVRAGQSTIKTWRSMPNVTSLLLPFVGEAGRLHRV